MATLSFEAKEFLTKLHRQFSEQRLDLLKKRATRQEMIDKGALPDFLVETAPIRNDLSWKVAPAPSDLKQRFVEITGPVEKKMMINALNSGADVFMADFEDALSPTWENVLNGQQNLIDAITGTLSYTSPEGKHYALKEKTAVLVVRPRGWHLDEKHMLIDGSPMSASLFDFGLYLFNNAHSLLKNGSGPYFYLPKLESHLEARLWNDVFVFATAELGLPKGCIRATVLIETILAAFEMEEILYELREHCSGLNAGRWDYLFSIIKKFHAKKGFVFPDRAQLTMTVPFMRAYTELLVKTCHKRGAHAIGGMAAFIPSRKDPEINRVALQKVTEDKLRESRDGFDGTWVAHPDLVPVAMEVFQKAIPEGFDQKSRLRDEVQVSAAELLYFRVPDGKITEKGVRQNISVAVQYLASWLAGQGACALFNLMEDAATAEISRAQIWQWLHQPNGVLDDGRKIDLALFRTLLDEEMAKISAPKVQLARELFERLVTKSEFEEFLTLLSYACLER